MRQRKGKGGGGKRQLWLPVANCGNRWQTVAAVRSRHRKYSGVMEWRHRERELNTFRNSNGSVLTTCWLSATGWYQGPDIYLFFFPRPFYFIFAWSTVSKSNVPGNKWKNKNKQNHSMLLDSMHNQVQYSRSVSFLKVTSINCIMRSDVQVRVHCCDFYKTFIFFMFWDISILNLHRKIYQEFNK